MFSRHALLIAVLLVLSAASLASAQQRVPTAMLDSVNRTGAAFIAAWSGDDPDAVAAFFAENAVVIVQGGRIFRGHNEILDGYIRPLVRRISEVRPIVAEVTAGDGVVVFAGQYSARFTPPGEVLSAMFSNTWERQSDGSWKIRTSATEVPVIPPDGAVRAVVESLVKAWSSHDVSGFDTLFAADARYQDMAVGFDGRGVGEIRGFFEGTLAAIPNFHVEVSRMLVDGQRVATEWTMSGTQTGALGELPATGNSFSVPGLSITLVQNGKIVAHRDYYDEQELLRQLAGESAPDAY